MDRNTSMQVLAYLKLVLTDKKRNTNIQFDKQYNIISKCINDYFNVFTNEAGIAENTISKFCLGLKCFTVIVSNKEYYIKIKNNDVFRDNFIKHCLEGIIPYELVKDFVGNFDYQKHLQNKLNTYPYSFETIDLIELAKRADVAGFRKIMFTDNKEIVKIILNSPVGLANTDDVYADLVINQADDFIGSGGKVYTRNQYGIYELDNDNVAIKRKIVQDMKPKLEKYIEDIFEEQFGNEEQDKENPELARFQKNKLCMIQSFGNTSSVNSVANMVAIKIYQRELNFDMNHNLLAMKNGVWDLQTMSFRIAEYDEYVLFNTKIHFDEDWTTTDEKTPIENYILKNLQNNFENEEELQTYIRLLGASGFVCTGRYIFINKSGGENGKSLLYDYIPNQIFGDYYYTVPPSMITGKAVGAGQANPDLLHLRNKRWATANEPEGNRFNITGLKLLSGNDSVSTRDFYSSKKITFRNTASINILCNNDIDYDKDSDANTSRMLVYHHKSVFKNPAWLSQHVGKGKTYESLEECKKYNIYPQDPDFKNCFQKDIYKVAMWKIIFRQLYEDKQNDIGKQIFEQKFIGNVGFIPSPKMVESTTEEKELDESPYDKFMKEYKINDPGLTENDYIVAPDLYKEYKKFVDIYNSNCLDKSKRQKALSNQEFYQKIEKKNKIQKTKLKKANNREVFIRSKHSPIHQVEDDDEIEILVDELDTPKQQQQPIKIKIKRPTQE